VIPIKVDTTGLTCPLPFFKLRRALMGVAPGTLIEVLSSDPLAPGDFAELCAAQGHRLIECQLQGAAARTLIETARPLRA
jgi:tRNA 2-thiouridine synthesizing protein A